MQSESNTNPELPDTQEEAEILYDVNWDKPRESPYPVEEHLNGTSENDTPMSRLITPSPSEEEFEIISNDEAFSAPSQPISSPPPPGKADHIPVVSQVKSIIQLAKGREIGAKHTQKNFSKGAIVVSQVRSMVEYAKGDVEAAQETREYFWCHSSLRNIDKTPVVGHVKGGIHYLLGDKERGANIIRSSTDSIMNSSVYERLRGRSHNDRLDGSNENSEFGGRSGGVPEDGISEISRCTAAMNMEDEEKYLEYNKHKREYQSCYWPD